MDGGEVAEGGDSFGEGVGMCRGLDEDHGGPTTSVFIVHQQTMDGAMRLTQNHTHYE